MIQHLPLTFALILLASAASAACPQGDRTPRALREEPRSALETDSGWENTDPSAAAVYLDSPTACVEIDIPRPDLTNDPLWQPRPIPETFRGTVLNSWELPDPAAPRWP